MAEYSLETEKGKEFQASFYRSLGSFITLFSLAESILRDLMTHLAKADEATALALFSGVRTDQAIANIRRLYQARKETMPAALDKALQQLAVISGFRNDLLHHRVDFEQSPPVTTNRASVLTESAIRETVIVPETLLQAGMDLARITLVLNAIREPGSASQSSIDFAMREPWMHKPASQPRKHPPENKDRPKPPRPPKASRE